LHDIPRAYVGVDNACARYVIYYAADILEYDCGSFFSVGQGDFLNCLGIAFIADITDQDFAETASHWELYL